MIAFDDRYREQGYKQLCGVDEVGRGPLAGPVVAAAVIFAPGVVIEGINDSKKLTERKRESLYARIVAESETYGYALVSPERIDEINILQASLEAMRIAVSQLTVEPDLILIDGNKTFAHAAKREAIVKGDAKSFSIAAASIVAKVIRDRLMVELDKEFPHFNWSRNKGYPTKDHIRAVLEYGSCIHHRKSFLKNIPVWQQNGLFDQQTGP